MIPPHLPLREVRERDDRFRRLMWLLCIVLLSGLSGLAAALATIAWIAPITSTDLSWRFREINRGATDATIDATVASETRKRLVVLYDISKKNNLPIYPPESRIGYAVLLTSDGWAVAYLPNLRPHQEKTWEGIDQQGIRRGIERVYRDVIGRTLYIKFSGNGFHVISFARKETLAFGATAWTLDGDVWRRVTMDVPQRASNDATYPLWRPEYFFRLKGDISSGDILFTDSGELTGIADEHRALLPAWNIEAHIPTLLANGQVEYPSIGLEGYVISGVSEGETVKPVTGFYLTKVSGKSAKALLRGDIIMRINGKSLSPEAMAEDLVSVPDSVTLVVERSGEEKEIIVPLK